MTVKFQLHLLAEFGYRDRAHQETLIHMTEEVGERLLFPLQICMKKLFGTQPRNMMETMWRLSFGRAKPVHSQSAHASNQIATRRSAFIERVSRLQRS